MFFQNERSKVENWFKPEISQACETKENTFYLLYFIPKEKIECKKVENKKRLIEVTEGAVGWAPKGTPKQLSP